jgi:integrase
MIQETRPRGKDAVDAAYESAARTESILALDIADLDLENKRGRITAKGGIVRWAHWQSGTARLLPRLIAARTCGPLFLADRRPAPARTPAAADLCPITGRGWLSYERARFLFKQATTTLDPRRCGYTLHQLRHSRLTHLAEDGWSAPILMGLSGHENIRSLAIHTKRHRRVRRCRPRRTRPRPPTPLTRPPGWRRSSPQVKDRFVEFSAITTRTPYGLGGV